MRPFLYRALSSHRRCFNDEGGFRGGLPSVERVKGRWLMVGDTSSVLYGTSRDHSYAHRSTEPHTKREPDTRTLRL